MSIRSKFFVRISYITVLFFGTSYANNPENITVIGIGRLGICTALVLEQAGYHVCGVDVRPNYVEQLNNKTFQSDEPYITELLQKSSHFYAAISLDEGLNFSDIYLIVVATPTSLEQGYDHGMLNHVLGEINKRKVSNKHVVICCTVFPGYIHNTGQKLLQDCINTTLSYNPEFIAQGNIVHDFQYPDIILIGEGSREAGDRLQEIYKKVCKSNPTICRMSPASAEITKLAINCFVTTKIAFANMIGDIADATENADKYAILQAVGNDSRVGNKYLKPGYGFGGPCFPRDNRALATYAEQVRVNPFIPYATDASNKYHAQFMATMMEKENREVFDFYEVTYKDKCTVPIIEESQKLIVAAYLAQRGKRVRIHDCKAVLNLVRQEYGDMFEYYETAS